ncbi:MAG: Holliday junction resolvase RuvX [Burkholderiales bacterium]|nr:MAG: Holliday junction resolvase RuvX [Burkholderiales bacterium]
MSTGETVLAFDFGLKRIGVAVGNTVTGGARPLEVLHAETRAQRAAGVARLLADWRPARLVVGRPLHPDGSPHAMTRSAERFARALQAAHRLPVMLVDERFSSAVLERGGSRADDAQSAALILQQYFDERQAA